MAHNPDVARFLDADLRVKIWPAKQRKKLIVLEYLASKFERGVEYTEKEVNARLQEWHIFNDVALLRRALFDYGFMERHADGSRYWVIDTRVERTSDAV